MRYLDERFGAQVCTTVIFDTNERARAALTERKAHRQGQPVYAVLAPFTMTSVQMTRARPPASARVGGVEASELPALCDFLARAQKERPFGEVVTRELLERRFTKWPGFGLASFLVARDSSGSIVGCLAPWDTGEVKRTRVLGYHGGMRWQRPLFDMGARLFGYPRLPATGECFRFAFLTHLEIAHDDPAVLHDLLLAAYARLRSTGLHFMSACVPRGSPLERAFEGFFVTKTRMTLYTVCAEGSPWAGRSFASLHPGFEMALS
jgi:hypothetical protein